MGGAVKKVSKSVKKVVKKVVSVVADVAVGIASGEYILKVTGKIVQFAGDKVLDDALGLDKIGNEVEQIGSDVYQIGSVLGGDYHDDLKRIQEMEAQVKSFSSSLDKQFSAYSFRIDSYNLSLSALQERVDSLIAFDEIFQMAASNNIDRFITNNQSMLDRSELDVMNAQYKNMVATLKRLISELKTDYDFVIGLTQGSFIEKLIGSVLMIIGGLMSDIKEIADGKANSDTWKRVGTAIVGIIAIVALFFIPGLQGVGLALAVTLASISLLMTLDGMYANGTFTGAIMSMLDFIFNDLLNLDDLIGNDFDKFDKDHEDYHQMVGYVQLALVLANILVIWVSVPSQAMTSSVTEVVSTDAGFVAAESAEGQAALGTTSANTSTSYLNGALEINETNMGSSTLFGVSFNTYSDTYKAFSAAASVNDLIGMNYQYEQLKSQLESDLDKVNEAIASKTNKSMMKHYRDSAYFLQDQQEFIDRYIWSMTSENMYVDPYGTTPVANIRFEPDKKTRSVSFGFEDLFDENKQAGSKNYFNSIIYGM